MAGAEPDGEASQRPDMIVVMVDDLGYLDDERVLERLPAIRDLWLDDGIRFREAFNEIPLCCPARANFHSGKHSYHNGIVVNDRTGFDNSSTLATAIDTGGYHTLFVGKYLNSYDGSRAPPGWDRAAITKGSPPSIADPQFWIDGELTTFHDRFFDDVVRETALGWLEEAPGDEPVFEVVAPYAPHRHRLRCAGRNLTCRMTPAVMESDRGDPACAGIPRFRPPSYSTTFDFRAAILRVPPGWKDGWRLRPTCESLLVVDRMVGQLRAAQARRGRPAYFVFLSDNGMAWGQHGQPLKHVPWSTRLPLYVAGPGIDQRTEDARVSIIDIPVTLADIAGTEIPDADGISFYGTLRGNAFSGRDEILELMPSPPAGYKDVYLGWAAIRSGRWRYIRWDFGLQELYDVERDPWELDDRSSAKPGVVKRLDARLDELIEDSRQGVDPASLPYGPPKPPTKRQAAAIEARRASR